MKRFFVFFIIVVLMYENVLANENIVKDYGEYITFDDYLMYVVYATDFFPLLKILI